MCLREVGGDCRAARGQSGHASSAATFKDHQSNIVRFAGSAENIAHAGCSRDLAADQEALTRACAMLEVTAELHVDKVATQALLQLRNVTKTTA